MYSGKNGSLFLKSDKAISGENLNMLKDCLAPDCLTTLSNQSPTAKKSLLHKGETKDTSIVDWTQCGNSECTTPTYQGGSPPRVLHVRGQHLGPCRVDRAGL